VIVRKYFLRSDSKWDKSHCPVECSTWEVHGGMLCAQNVCMGGHSTMNYQCGYYYISKTLQQF